MQYKCQKCGYVNLTYIRNDGEEADDPVMTKLAEGSSIGIGVGAGCATWFIIMFLFSTLVAVFHYFTGFYDLFER
jgi:hypothetical protein